MIRSWIFKASVLTTEQIFCGDQGNVCNVQLPDRNAKEKQDPVCADVSSYSFLVICFH